MIVYELVWFSSVLLCIPLVNTRNSRLELRLSKKYCVVKSYTPIYKNTPHNN